MLFPTLDFGVFFLVVFVVGWAVRHYPESRKLFLVAASYFFYGYWDWRFCFLLAGNSAVNYATGLLIEATDDRRRRRWILGVGVALNLVTLGFFKYYGFFVESLNDVMFSVGLERELPFLEIVLPVGISFFTFQGISYIVDVNRGVIPASRSILNVFLYISFFPQLVAGPIVRAQVMMPQLERPPDPSRTMAAMGLLLIIVGLFKKVVVANYLATEIVDAVFFDPLAYGPVDLTLAIWGYAIQIYCDFSAYSDIAIGVAALLGYRFQKNFRQPYRAESIRELWRRWHISLSTWLRDYLYIPLGGSRVGPVRMRINLFLTMFLGGIWHGAAWTYIFWGTRHGLAMVVESWFDRGDRPRRRVLWRSALAVFFTFNFNCLSFIFFRSETLGMAFDYLGAFGNLGAEVMFATPLVLSLVFGGFAVHFLREDWLERVEARIRHLPPVMLGMLAGLAVVAIAAMGPEGVAPFIYFQF